jgi:hypothetical protein
MLATSWISGRVKTGCGHILMTAPCTRTMTDFRSAERNDVMACNVKETHTLYHIFSWHFAISGVLVMGVRLTSHWTAASFTGLSSVPGWGWVKGWMNEWTFFFNFRKSGAHDGMILTGENRRTRRKTCPSATLSTTNPTGLAWARTPTFCHSV